MTTPLEHENQQTVTPEETRQSMLAELDATQQAIVELSDEQLEDVAGGAGWGKLFGRSGSSAGTAAGHTAGAAAGKSSFMSDLKSGAIQGAAFLGISKLLGQ